MELKTVQTHHVPVRYLEGGSGPDLVYLHGAGGVTAEDPLLNLLARSPDGERLLCSWVFPTAEHPELLALLDAELAFWRRAGFERVEADGSSTT